MTWSIRTALPLMGLALAAALSVSAARADPVHASLGVPFALGIGGEAEIEGRGVVIRFTAVLEDSRCPIDVMCVWAGLVRIGLDVEITAADETRHTEEIAVETVGGPVFAAGMAISILQVKPSRQASVPVQPGAYGVLLLVDDAS